MCAAAAAAVVVVAEITTDAVWIICLDLSLSLFLSRFFLVKSGREYRLRSICPIAAVAAAAAAAALLWCALWPSSPSYVANLLLVTNWQTLCFSLSFSSLEQSSEPCLPTRQTPNAIVNFWLLFSITTAAAAAAWMLLLFAVRWKLKNRKGKSYRTLITD